MAHFVARRQICRRFQFSNTLDFMKTVHQLKLVIIKEKRQSIMKLSFLCNIKTFLKKCIGQWSRYATN